MSVLHTLALYIFHVLYALSEVFALFKSYLFTRADADENQNDEEQLWSTLRSRGKVPEHVAIAFIRVPSLGSSTRRSKKAREAEEEVVAAGLVQDSKRVVEWCSRVGISKVTLYDREGLLKSRLRNSPFSSSSSSLSSLPIPTPPIISKPASKPRWNSRNQTDSYLTPPPSDDSESSAATSVVDGVNGEDDENLIEFDYVPSAIQSTSLDLSTTQDDGMLRQRRRTNSTSLGCTVQVRIASYNESLPAIARAARWLKQSRSSVSVPVLDEMLLSELPPPQLLVLHNTTQPSLLDRISSPRHLDAFPPWHLRLSEIHWTLSSYSFSLRKTNGYVPFKRSMFTHALDDYAKAEMREGK